MKLYHGSNTPVAVPKIIDRLRALDFGAGFYLTSSYEQARKWAIAVAKRRRTGVPTVCSYEIDDAECNDLKILRFDAPTIAWLDFVVANRKELYQAISYDLVIGPVANDATLPVIDDYMDNRYTSEQAVEKLLPQKLTDQYAFLSSKALNILKFHNSEVVQ